MARPRFDRLEPARQEALLAAAAEEFAERGYAAASLSRIVERAGSSKGSLYYYFEDKADLLATVVERAWDNLLTSVAWPQLSAFTAENYWDRVRELAQANAMPLMEQDTWAMRVMRSFYRLREEAPARQATAKLLDRGRDMIRAFLERGRELGAVRTDLPLELLVEVYMGADQAGDRWMLAHWDGFDERQKVELLMARVDLARDMLDARHMGWGR